MARGFLIVLDSVGIGGAPDAGEYGDAGSNTLGHIAEACAGDGLQRTPLALPNLVRLGLARAARLATGRTPPGLEEVTEPEGLYGTAVETSKGKDTPSGHWEIAGVPVRRAWGTFPEAVPCFPPELILELCRRAALPGILGDCHASGTAIIAALGSEHIRTGKPICYTSADSVFQIAAHEEHFGLERLYDLCGIARELTRPLRIGRVIARPFMGAADGPFERTANRKDLSEEPPGETLLDIATASGRDVVTLGKTADIFAGRGTGRIVKAKSNAELFDRLLETVTSLADGGLAFANFVDFDTLFGHRRDVKGYAAALEAFDARLPVLRARLAPSDVVLITADHGCDPTWPGSDHTREQVPVLAFGPRIGARCIGTRPSFADIGASLCAYLSLRLPASGTPFLAAPPVEPAADSAAA